ncbi:MAG TPA: ribbon-helix-helix protein, CopG family [Geobacteraceae bacterium]
MGRMRENPRYNVISMRISDDEREALETIMTATRKNVSEIMREAMELVKNRLAREVMEKKAA